MGPASAPTPRSLAINTRFRAAAIANATRLSLFSDFTFRGIIHISAYKAQPNAVFCPCSIMINAWPASGRAVPHGSRWGAAGRGACSHTKHKGWWVHRRLVPPFGQSLIDRQVGARTTQRQRSKHAVDRTAFASLRRRRVSSPGGGAANALHVSRENRKERRPV